MAHRDPALKVAGLFFFLIATAQALRIVFKFSVTINGIEVPLWVNVAICAVASLMAAWMFSAARGRRG